MDEVVGATVEDVAEVSVTTWASLGAGCGLLGLVVVGGCVAYCLYKKRLVHAI